MGGGLHLASRTPQLAMSPGPARVLASRGSWQVWPLSVVHASCSSRWTARPAPLMFEFPKGVVPLKWAAQVSLGRGFFPLVSIPALKAHSPSPLCSLFPCLRYQPALPAPRVPHYPLHRCTTQHHPSLPHWPLPFFFYRYSSC
jgi:hypothetical protein